LLASRSENTIPRAFLSGYKPASTHVEVISGIRRCGKSTLMALIRDQFYPGAAYFNFEDSRVYGFEVDDFRKLDDIIPRDTPAYFFDEIQNVDKWELFVRQLHDRGSKVFITGSNASLLSHELGTRLTGRHLRHDLYPFSYQEFLSYHQITSSEDAFDRYLDEGGFPEYQAQKDPMILQNLFKDIVLRDIAVRHGIRNIQTLMEMALFLITNSGKETTYNSIRKQFNMGAANTAADFIHWLEDSWLIFQVQRFNWSPKSRSANPRKIYGIDTGLIQANTLSFSADRGRRLENVVYLHLRQSGKDIFYFREDKECDFVVFDQRKCVMAIQVCEKITPDNQKRETEGLMEAMQTFGLVEGIIITRNQSDTITTGHKIIQMIPAYRFIGN
jgi:uncharacterized protein